MSIKTWLFGEANTVANTVKTDLNEEWQKAKALASSEAAKARAISALPAHLRDEWSAGKSMVTGLVGADLGKLKTEAENAAKVLSETGARIHNELVRLQGEYENTVLALKGYEKLIAHYAGNVADEIDLGDLTKQPEPQPEPAPIVMTHTDITTGNAPAVPEAQPLQALAPGADPVLDAGEQAAAQAARDALAKLPKRRVFGQS